MVVCQGCVEAAQKKLMYRQMPSYADKMKIMFEEGDNHPDDDLRNARNDWMLADNEKLNAVVWKAKKVRKNELFCFLAC